MIHLINCSFLQVNWQSALQFMIVKVGFLAIFLLTFLGQIFVPVYDNYHLLFLYGIMILHQSSIHEVYH